MKKIPTVFRRNPDNLRELLDEPHPDCGWVFAGEGVATQKYDGTCVLIREGRYFKRREVGRGKSAPAGFREQDHDEVTGKRVGWVEAIISNRANFGSGRTSHQTSFRPPGSSCPPEYMPFLPKSGQKISSNRWSPLCAAGSTGCLRQ